MTQYLIKTITHDTGEVFKDVVKARENETFELVEVENEREMKNIDGFNKKNINNIGILITYELTKYVITELIIRIQANDDIDRPPKDFTDSNQDDLNELYKYIMNNETNHEVDDGLF